MEIFLTTYDIILDEHNLDYSKEWLTGIRKRLYNKDNINLRCTKLIRYFRRTVNINIFLIYLSKSKKIH